VNSPTTLLASNLLARRRKERPKLSLKFSNSEGEGKKKKKRMALSCKTRRRKVGSVYIHRAVRERREKKREAVIDFVEGKREERRVKE